MSCLYFSFIIENFLLDLRPLVQCCEFSTFLLNVDTYLRILILKMRKYVK